MTSGISGDVNNSILLQGAYPVGRTFGMVGASATDFSMRNNYAGELGGLNQDYARSMMMRAPAGGAMAAPAAAPTAARGNGNGGKRPAFAWLAFAIFFVFVAWAARRFAPDGEQFAIIRPNLINWVFVTLTVILTSVFLKQVAMRVEKIPILEPAAKLVLAA